MKKISIMIPTYNEEENVVPLYDAVIDVFKKDLRNYGYEILFIDNKSKDGTREKIKFLCNKDKNVKAIFNVRNFGQANSPYYALMQTTGDCTISMCADFQDPVDMLPRFVNEWESGYKIVIGIKATSKENKTMYFLRSCYYKIIKKMSDVDQIEQFTGFGLYDRDFIKILCSLDESAPYFRGIVAEIGYERKELEYTQEKRRSGKTSNNWYKLYDMAMLGITSYTKIAMRMATILGFTIAGLSFVVAVAYFILKLIYWDSFPMGIAPIIISIFFFSSVQLFFIGFLGEYILNINNRIMKRPLIVEEKRINFEKKD